MECKWDRQEYYTDEQYVCKEMYRDGQEYHTDRKLHMIGNVQGQT